MIESKNIFNNSAQKLKTDDQTNQYKSPAFNESQNEAPSFNFGNAPPTDTSVIKPVAMKASVAP
jgi:hypothetical protein